MLLASLRAARRRYPRGLTNRRPLVLRPLASPLAWLPTRGLANAAKPSAERSTLVTAAPASGGDVLTNQGSIKRTKEKSLLHHYVKLAKPELSALVIATGVWGFAISGSPDLIAGVSTISGLVLSAASAAAWNQAREGSFDKLMIRTRTRPVPSGIITKEQAYKFSGATGLGGVALLTLGANPLSGALGLANIVLYGQVYTPMKRWSVYNTHVGAVVGALPVVIGFAGGGGSLMAVEPAILFSIMCAWQFPHFMGIAWKYRDDYKRAGYNMITRDDPSGALTSNWMINGQLVLCALPFFSTFFGMTNSMFLVSSALPNALMYLLTKKFEAKPSSKAAGNVIKYGIMYIMVFLGLMFFHSTSISLLENVDRVRTTLRDLGRAMCVHETKMTDVPDLCPTAPAVTTGSATLPKLPVDVTPGVSGVLALASDDGEGGVTEGEGGSS